MFGYTLADIRAVLAQWDSSLTDADLAPCAIGGQFYAKAAAEVQAALMSAGYDPNPTTPISYELAKGLLIDGIAAYFVESRRAASYPAAGFDPVAGLFSRYRRKLKDIEGGAIFGEWGQKKSAAAALYKKGPICGYFRGL